ncbi:uncharacterized protein MICPUCDRAFT_51808 [Micromonas pusilla CCMP1545]|uniref:Predicted protein n=1 Tax=Micromonas pusilla (strain CCMP1545) TaxID=564608 RepID=C1N210_MICPC|nr:uncharacterized protein MICPUCDRAFT_51808 [Micromonas pusilla CCMP1545]EEH53720.1 predicted protein [Micromonas pusilla CCMP1545]|eukprot:XP_003062008.1 predicted protein [Micromonas pusilla CCMP1545]
MDIVVSRERAKRFSTCDVRRTSSDTNGFADAVVSSRSTDPRAALIHRARRSMAALTTVPLVLGAKPALRGAKVASKAAPKASDLFTLFDSIDKTADKIEGAFGAAAGAAGKAADAVSAAATVAKPFAEKAVDAAAPLLDATGKYAERTVAPLAGEAIKTAGSAAGGVAGSAANAIKSRGIDVEPVAGAAGAAGKLAGDFATTTAAPALEKFGDYLSTASPTDLAELGAGVLAAYFIAPALLGVVASSARGYAGSGAFHLALFFRPVEAYDDVLNKKNVVVVDVRRENEVERGEVDFPRRAASRVLQVPREQLRGNFKNSSAVDANLTALKVANLKGVKRGTKVYLLDANGGDAPKVAKALTAQGFGKVYVIQGGFNGWASAGLGVQ